MVYATTSQPLLMDSGSFIVPSGNGNGQGIHLLCLIGKINLKVKSQGQYMNFRLVAGWIALNGFCFMPLLHGPYCYCWMATGHTITQEFIHLAASEGVFVLLPNTTHIS